MKIALIGLGLIGGSLAYAIRSRTAHTIYGLDRDPAVLAAASAAGVLDAQLTEQALASCDLVALALFPSACVDWLRENAKYLRRNAVVFDCAGVKEPVCSPCFTLAAEHGFSFIGGHPMAGTEHTGWQAARPGLFDGAAMILVPQPGEILSERESAAEQMLAAFFSSLGFGSITRTTAARHDRIIAYTSQLAHVVSSAYIKSPTAQEYLGFSAGSFKDMTRVALLNEVMWSELFLANRTALSREIDLLIEHLCQYQAALAAGDAEQLSALLAEGKAKKTQSDEKEAEK